MSWHPPTRFIPDRPRGARYPLDVPSLRERNPEFEQLFVDLLRAVGRRRFPPVDTDPDRIRFQIFLWRVLYSPEWPDHETWQSLRRKG